MLTSTTLLPWLAAVLSLSLAYPWARWLLDLPHDPQEPRPREPALALLLTVGLSLGGLAWLLTLLAAISPALVAFWPVTLAGLALSGVGWGLWRRRGGRRAAPATPGQGCGRRGWASRVAVGAIVALVGLTLFNAAYWPFREDDTMALYGPMAYRFAQSGRFDGAGLYDAYPRLVPLAMAYPHLAGGAPNEYIARLVTAVLALGTVGAAYALGRDLYGRTVGLGAAFLTVTVPILPHWSASGYTDLPAGTTYALATIFAWRLFSRPHPVHALLAGGMAGLAVLTKNGAWLVAASLAGWAAYSRVYGRPAAGNSAPPGGVAGHPISLPHLALMIGAFLVVAGPWYGHALLAYGQLIPPTGWTEQADHSLGALLRPALTPSHFLVSGPLGMAGLGGMLAALWRSRRRPDPRPALLVGFAAPFWLVWWWFFSYDLRFLLLVWPLFAVMGAWAAARLGGLLPPAWQRRAARALPLALIVIALPAARMAVDHKGEILRNPLMSDAERHRVQLGTRYEVIEWIGEHVPAEARLLTSDYLFVYPLMQSHTEPFVWDTREQEQVSRFDYWIVGPDFAPPAWADAQTLRLRYESGGYAVYEVLHHER